MRTSASLLPCFRQARFGSCAKGVYVLNGRIWLAAGAALLIVIIAFTYNDDASVNTVRTTESAPRPNTGEQPRAAPIVDSDGTSPGAGTAPPPVTGDVQMNEGDAAFRTDAAGNLVVDEQTRLDLEALSAQTDSNDWHAELREQTAQLPPDAARKAEELANQFVQYQQAQRQTYPPRETALT